MRLIDISNNAQCWNTCCLQAFEMWADHCTTSGFFSSIYPHSGPTHERSKIADTTMPPLADFYSRVCRTVRTDRSHEKMGGNVWCPTMPISSGRRCKGQGVEVRNQLWSRKMKSPYWAQWWSSSGEVLRFSKSTNVTLLKQSVTSKSHASEMLLYYFSSYYFHYGFICCLFSLLFNWLFSLWKIKMLKIVRNSTLKLLQIN